jgi:integrase
MAARTRHVNLTHFVIENVDPDPRRRTEIVDIGSGGLLRLLIQPSGALSWVMRFRRPVGTAKAGHVGGAVVKLTLGGYKTSPSQLRPEIGCKMTLAEARSVAMEVDRRRQTGEDVFQVEKRRRLAARGSSSPDSVLTFEAACRDYVERFAMKETRRWQRVAAILGLRYDGAGQPSIIEGRPADLWRGHPVEVVDRAAIKALVEKVGERTPQQAGAVRSALHALYEWLKYEGAVNVNPASSVRKPKTNSRDRVLTDEEVTAFWHATAREDAPYRDAMRCLLLLGQRREEVSAMRWSELSEDLAEWVIPAERYKTRQQHKVPLSPQVQSIIRGTRRIARSDFVFTMRGKAAVDLGAAKGRVATAMGDLPRWTLHDLRRTCSTVMNEKLGVRPEIVEAVQGRAKSGVAGIYNRAEYAPQRRKALEDFAGWVEGLVDAGARDTKPKKKRK